MAANTDGLQGGSSTSLPKTAKERRDALTKPMTNVFRSNAPFHYAFSAEQQAANAWLSCSKPRPQGSPPPE